MSEATREKTAKTWIGALVSKNSCGGRHL